MSQVTESLELTPAEAARQIGCYDLNRVYRDLWVGRLQGRKVDGRWLVSEQSVREYIGKREARKAAAQ